MLIGITIISALTGLAATVPTLLPRSENSNIFVAIASHYGIESVHERGIAASGGRFYLNKATSAYCPNTSQIDCSAYQNTTTVFSYDPTGKTLSLNVAVPGGELVYVAPNGELGYTLPHSASYPQGSSITPFACKSPPRESGVRLLTFQNGDFHACPITSQEEIYQIFATAYGDHGKYQKDCISLVFVTAEYQGDQAWEY